MLGGIFFLSQRFGGVGGMSSAEVLFMLGYSTLTTGLYLMFFNNCNVGNISRVIGRGQLDHKLIQPLPINVQLMTEGFAPISGSANLWIGIVICVIALSQLHITVTIWWVLLLIISLATTMIILLGMLYLASFVTFYAPVAAEEITSQVLNDLNWTLSSYPLSGMPSAVRLILITILPSGLTAWFPACAMLGKSPFNLTICFPVAVAAVLVFLATITFKKGLKYYEKIGSQRYSDFGHRR
jgi:ABC-2 type transport system permease protein